jgi:hypothetical protein
MAQNSVMARLCITNLSKEVGAGVRAHDGNKCAQLLSLREKTSHSYKPLLAQQQQFIIESITNITNTILSPVEFEDVVAFHLLTYVALIQGDFSVAECVLFFIKLCAT